MPATKKVYTVDNLAEKFKQTKALILSDYSGLKVSQISELRREIKKTGAEFEVVKNSLLELAGKNSLFPVSAPKLNGPTAALWLYQEDVQPLKALFDFIKKNELPKVKLGFWLGELISPERVKELANLPSLEQLQAKLVWTLQSPISGLVNSLNYNMRKLILVLKEVKKND